MKYKAKELTINLKEKIANMEERLEMVSALLLQRYAPLFIEKNMELFIEFERSKKNPFEAGYESSISIAVTDENGDMIDFYRIPIWECERHFLGLPVLVKIPGSRITGELMDESEKEVEMEIAEHLEELLQLPN
ncbi:MAG TPA: hypothetical protein VNM45_03230 [Bacillus sp. (in: firmicutes)]|nr:hypothetical protein [Bacillus sp. (in: firmicutes)]